MSKTRTCDSVVNSVCWIFLNKMFRVSDFFCLELWIGICHFFRSPHQKPSDDNPVGLFLGMLVFKPGNLYDIQLLQSTPPEK